MPTWKTMAEAFGRALYRPGTGTRNNIIKKAAENLDDDVARAAYDYGRSRSEDFENIAAERAGGDYIGPTYKETFNKVESNATDKTLRSDFEREFERSLRAAAERQHTTNHGDMLGTARDIEDDFREQAIEMLKRGRPIEDVLDILRQTGSQRPKLGHISSGE